MKKLHFWFNYESWKNIGNHLLGWLTFYRLGWVEFYRYQKFKIDFVKRNFGIKIGLFLRFRQVVVGALFKCPSMRRSGNLSSLTLKLLVSSLTKKMLGVGPGPGPLSNTHVKHHITLARNSHTNVTWARDSHNSKVNELLLLKGAKPKLDISMGFQSKPKILKILLDGA